MDTIEQQSVPKMNAKKKKLNKKLRSLIYDKNRILQSKMTRPDEKKMKNDKNKFVRNLSSVQFDDNAMELLSKGLNYAPVPNKLPLLDLVAEIETGIQYMPESSKINIRKEVTPVIRHALENENRTPRTNEQQKFIKATKILREKDCIYTKSDKGRDMVIMDRTDYVEKMTEITNGDNFKPIQRDPLPSMKKGLAVILKNIGNVFGNRTKWKLMVGNPSVPKMYGLPKTHKPILKMRPIVSNIGSPTEKVAK